jgi:hypothetical protein
MAKKKANQGRRVVSPLADSSQDYTGPSSADMKSELDFYGKKRAQLVDISSEMESIFSLQQNQRREIDQMYGIEKKMLDNLGFMANQVKIVALQKQASRDLSLEESNILKTTISDYETYNQEAAAVAKKSKELLDFRKKTVPFEDKIRGIQAEIGAMQVTGIKNLNSQEKERLKGLQTMEKGYQALSKQEQMNQRIEKIQGSITDLMENQGGAASQIFSTLKDIVTNPLTLFTGLLAVGLSRFETMRQRGNELAEEMDRVNKKLAGAGPFQDKILQKADLIKKRFYEMGEGFSSSLEGSVDAIVALESQFGKIDYVSGKLVKTMAELKLSIGLSDEESAKVLDNFSIVGGMTDEAAVNMTKMTYQMSEQAGLNPQVIFQDIASASGDTLASFSGSADELAKSAVTARRLGLTLDDMTKVSSALLDFETSIEKEMEAQLITGLDLNFQKARMLAMQGDEAGAMEEVMKQVGGLDKFNKMAPHQQRALAEAVGLTVGQLQKSTAQRQREAKQAQMKQDLVQKQYDLAEKALPMLGKLDAGLGVMERIAKVIGDLFLDVFGVGLKELEATFFKFLESPAFKTGFTNLLYTIKGVIVGIKDAVMGTAAFIDKLSGGAIGGFLKSFASKDFSGSYGKAEGVGKTIGKGIAVLLGAKMLLGATPFTPMYVSMGGKFGSMFGGLKKLLSGPLTKGGLPDKRFAANKYGGGVMQNIGSKMFGGARGPAGLGGMSSSAGMALGGFAVGGAIVGKSIYDVATLKRNASGKEKGAANSKMVGASLGAAIGTAILPGIGTAVGAGIGYLGGYLAAETGIFDDKLDTARKNLVEQQTKFDKMQQIEQNKMMITERKHHGMIKSSFLELSGGTDDLTKEGLAKFKDKILKAGYVTEKQWTDAVSGGASAQDLLNLATNGATTKLQDFATEKQKEIDRLKADAGVQERQADIDMKTLTMESIGGISKDDIRAIVKEQGSISTNAFTGQEDALKNGRKEEYIEIVQDLIKRNTGLDVEVEKIEAALKVASKETSFYLSGQQKTSDIIEDVLGSLEETMETDITQMAASNQKKVNEILQTVHKKNDITTALGDGVDGSKVLKVADVSLKKEVQNQNNQKAAGGILADGGITYGPSHANGGIPTRYGELEGGEAVINKRSTAMFKDQLSQLNQAGGGVAFGDGGVTGKFKNGGIPVNPAMQALQDKLNYTPEGGYTLDELSKYANVKVGKAGVRYHNQMYNPRIKTPGSYTDTLDHRIRNYGMGVTWNLLDQDKAAHPHRKVYRLLSEQGEDAYNFNPYIRKSMGLDMGYGLQDDIDKNIGLSRYDYYGMRKSNAEMKKQLSNILAGSGVTTMQNIATSVIGAKPLAAAFSSLSKTYAAARMVGVKQMLPYMIKTLLKAGPLNGTKIALANAYGLDTVVGAGKDLYGLARHLVTPNGVEGDLGVTPNSPEGWVAAIDKIQHGQYSSGAMKTLSSYYGNKKNKTTKDYILKYATSLTGKYLTPMLDEKLGLPTPQKMAGMERGGITPSSPIKKVNDMILTKDGQMIETHEDDNLIAKKGGITQKPASGKSRVEELLEQLIMVTREGGDVYMDGAKVSAAVNQANYNA